jgi:hypothetical protein
LAVLLLVLSNRIETDLGITVLLAWVVVFLATMVVFTASLSQGIGWYDYSMVFTSGMLLAVVIGLVLGFNIYLIAFLVPFGIMCMLAVNWMFMDTGDEEIMKDLERLRKKIK